MHNVPDIRVMVGVPPDASTLLLMASLSTSVGIPAVAGQPSEVDICDVSIFVSTAVHLRVKI